MVVIGVALLICLALLMLDLVFVLALAATLVLALVVLTHAGGAPLVEALASIALLALVGLVLFRPVRFFVRELWTFMLEIIGHAPDKSRPDGMPERGTAEWHAWANREGRYSLD